MNKSILVLDTPNSCRDCSLRIDSYGQYEICAAHREEYNYPIVNEHYESRTKPDWCPLKPLPSYKDLKPDNSLESQLAYQYNQGYNSCLEYIERELE